MVELSGAHPRRCRLLLFFSLLIATSVSGVRGQGKILNLSGRGINVIYGGFITQGAEPMTVVLRALGPSLRAQGIPRASDDPVLQLYDGNGTPIQKNDDWRSGPDAQAIADVGLAPTNELESALLATVSPGMYTLLVFPYNNTYDAFGASVVEMYDLQMSASRFGNISTRGFLTSSNETV